MYSNVLSVLNLSDYIFKLTSLIVRFSFTIFVYI